MRPSIPTLALLALMSACAPKPDQGASATPSLVGPGGAQQPDLGSAAWRLVEIAGATIPRDMHPAQHPQNGGQQIVVGMPQFSTVVAIARYGHSSIISHRLSSPP